MHRSEAVAMITIRFGVLLLTTAVAGSPRTTSKSPALSESQRKPAGDQTRQPKLQPDVGVRSLAFVGDGKKLLSLRTGGSELWDVATGKLLRTYEQFPPRRAGELPLVAPFALSVDGRLVTFGSLDEPGLTVLDVATGTEPRRFKGLAVAEAVNVSIAFSTDGSLLALGGVPGIIHVWEIATGRKLHRLHWQDMENSELAFSADRRVLASGSRHGGIAVWEVATGKQLRTLGRNQPFETVCALKCSPDGSVVAARTPNGTLHLWSVATGKQLFEVPRDELNFDMLFSPNGRLVASWGASDHLIRVRDIATHKERRLEGHSDQIKCVAFSPDGTTLASSGSDRTLRFWDVETGKNRQRDCQMSRAVSAPNGRSIQFREEELVLI